MDSPFDVVAMVLVTEATKPCFAIVNRHLMSFVHQTAIPAFRQNLFYLPLNMSISLSAPSLLTFRANK